MNKKWLISILISFISIFVFTNKISATDMFTYNGVLFTEDTIYERFITKFTDFDINKYSNIYCYKESGYYFCYAIDNEYLNTMILKSSTDTTLTYTGSTSLGGGIKGYFLNIKSPSSSSSKGWNSNYTITLDEAYSNFYFPEMTEEQKSKITKIDFSKYTESTEDDEPEINIKANKLLIFIIDKTKNIYELIINNPMLLFIISIPLVYVCFLIIYKIFKR